MMTNELSTGKTIFILAVVVGCFAILWPKVFYPMLTASVKTSTQPAPQWRDPLNAHHLAQLCFLLEEQRDPLSGYHRWTEEECFSQLKSSCRVVLTERILEGFRLEKDKTNLTECLRQRFALTPQKVSAAAPPPTRTRPYQPNAVVHPHVRPERPSSLHSDALHPALREKGRAMPQRTIEKEARPGPMPGLRPPMGGGGHMVPPQSKGSGAMGIIMPLYTVGIVIFFIYTIMKVLFKKNCEEDKTPKLKDFHMDPEYRKYVFAEEYLDSANASHRDLLRRQEREASRQRRRQEVTPPDTKIGKPECEQKDEQMDQLRRRLEETERAMERLMSQMGSVTDKLTAAKITEVLSQAQAQAKMLKMGLDDVTNDTTSKDGAASFSSPPVLNFVIPQSTTTPKELGEGLSDDDFTTSEAFTNTYSEDYSLPIALQRHLQELQVKDQYLKGTSAGTFVPPPTPLQEVASQAEEEAPKGVEKADEFSPIPLSNGVNLVTNLSIDVKPKETEQEIKIVSTKSEDAKEKFAIKADKELIVTDDLVLSEKKKYENILPAIGKDLNRLILEAKLTGEFSAFSDIAQRDDNVSAGDRSSNPSETGADISELKSFADECAYPSANGESMPAVQKQIVPEASYHVPEVIMPKEIDMSEQAVHSKIKGIETGIKPVNLAFDSQQQPAVVALSNMPKGIEHGTQTDSDKKLSVLNFGTTYQINKQEQEKGMGIHEVEDKVNEIILDATLPMDTQLLVREAHVGSRPVENIEIDVTENENNPCVVTSQVSLAFVGLEQNEPQGAMTIILPEKRNLTVNCVEGMKKDMRDEQLTRLDEFPIKDNKDPKIDIAADPLLIPSKDAASQQLTHEKYLQEPEKPVEQNKSQLKSGFITLNDFSEEDHFGTEKVKCSSQLKDTADNLKTTEIRSNIDERENQKDEKLHEIGHKGNFPLESHVEHAKSQLKFGSISLNEFLKEDHYDAEKKICSSNSQNIAENLKTTQIEFNIDKYENQTDEEQHISEHEENFPLESQVQIGNTTSCTNENSRTTANMHESPVQNQISSSDIFLEDKIMNPELELNNTLQADDIPVSVQPTISEVETSAVKDYQIPQIEHRQISNVLATTPENADIFQQIQTVEDNLGQVIEEDFETLKEIIAEVTASSEQYYLEMFDDQLGCQNVEVDINKLMKSDEISIDRQNSSACQIQETGMDYKVTEENVLNKLEEPDHSDCAITPDTGPSDSDCPKTDVALKDSADIELRNMNENVPAMTTSESGLSVDNIDLQRELSIDDECTTHAEAQDTQEKEIYRIPSLIPPSPTIEGAEEKNMPFEVSSEAIPLIVEDTIVPPINCHSCLKNLTCSRELYLIVEVLVQRITSEALDIVSKMDSHKIKILKDEASLIMDACNLQSTSKTMELNKLVPKPYFGNNKEPTVQPGKLGDKSRVETIIEPNITTSENKTSTNPKISPIKDSQTSSHERRFAVVSAEHANGLPIVEPSNETMEILVVEPLVTSKQALHSSLRKQDESAFSAEEAVLLANKGVRSLLNEHPAQTADDDEIVGTKVDRSSSIVDISGNNKTENLSQTTTEEGLSGNDVIKYGYEVLNNSGMERESEISDEKAFDNKEEWPKEEGISAPKCRSEFGNVGASVEELTHCTEEAPLLPSTGD